MAIKKKIELLKAMSASYSETADALEKLGDAEQAEKWRLEANIIYGTVMILEDNSYATALARVYL